MGEGKRKEIDFATATAEELEAAGFKVKQRRPAGVGEYNRIKRKRGGGGKLVRGEHMPVGSMLERSSRKPKRHQGISRRPTEDLAEKSLEQEAKKAEDQKKAKP